MRLEWDEAKSRRNQAKHGIALSEAGRIFDRPMLVRRDERKDYGEPRWIALGDLNGIVVVLVFTRREERIRIISIRKGNRHERKIYQDRLKEASRRLEPGSEDDGPRD